jgi:hypothetical protein
MKQYNGIAPDTRPTSQKKKDWKASELVSTPVVEWKEKKKWNTYTERNQHKTNSCVAQSLSKMLEIVEKNETNKKVVFSASPIYAKRNNKPYAGMSLHDSLDIVKKHGTTTEKRIKSQHLTSDTAIEKEATKWTVADDTIADTYGIEAYATLDSYDIETIAGHIEQGRPVMLFIYAELNEYGEFPVIKNTSLDPQNALIRHAVVAVDYGLITGKKYLKIEDSAHFKNVSVRYFDESFLQRVYGAGVIFDRDNTVLPKKISHTFTKPMEFGERSADIVVLQDILKVEGFFPVVTESTGFYGEITRQAVDKFQAFHNVASIWELMMVKGKRVGAKTLAKLNELYGK